MALNVDKNNLPKVGQDFRNAQELARSKVQTSPFGAVKMDRVEVRPDPTYTQQAPVQQPVRQEPVRQQPAQPRMVQREDRQIPVTHFQDNPGTRKTSTGRTLKRTKNGNPYIYEDKYNHNGDIKFSRAEEEHYDLRMPKGQKAQFMQIAKQQKMSFNQMVLRAIEMYIQNTVR